MKAKKQLRGLTANETCERTGEEYRSISPRFAPMRRRGLIDHLLDNEGKVVKRNGQQVHIALQKPTSDKGAAEGASRNSDPDTSHTAARRVNAQRLENKVLKALWDEDH